MVAFDDVVEEVGSYGRFQVILTIVACGVIIPSTFNSNLPIYVLTVPRHRCALDNYPNDTYAVQSEYHRHLINISIPMEEHYGETEMSKCKIYRDIPDSPADSGNKALRKPVKCDKWVYDKTYFDRTVIEEINIVCDKKEWRAHANMAMMAGKLASALVQGICSDTFGRRKTLLCFVVFGVCSMFLNAFTFTLPALMIIRFLCGMATTSTYMGVYIIVLEFLGPKHRNTFNMAQTYVWLGGAFLIDGLAYGIRDFEYLSISLAVPSLVYLAAFWFVPESPRWLLSKGRVEEARDVVTKMCQKNVKPFPTKTFEALVKKIKEEREREEREKDERRRRNVEMKRHGMKALQLLDNAPENMITYLKHRRLAFVFAILMWNWITNSLVYDGIFFDVQNMSGSIYLNSFYGTLVDLVGNTLAFFLLDRYGRKIPYVGFLALCSVACLATIFPPLFASYQTSNTAVLILWIGARFGIGTAYNVLYLYCAEIYPTTIRNTAMSVSTLVSRVGSISAPYVADLGRIMGGDMKSAFPLMIFGGVGFIASISTYFIPESNGQNLPINIKEALNYGRKPLSQADIDYDMTSTPHSIEQTSSRDEDQPVSEYENYTQAVSWRELELKQMDDVMSYI